MAPTEVPATAVPAEVSTPSPAPSPTPTTGPRVVEITGFRVADIFRDYYDKRGGARTWGYPVSRLFLFQGRQVQFFQGAVFQTTPWGGVARLNLLDGGFMPYTQINFSSLPPVDEELYRNAPQVGEEEYATRAMEFVRANAPDQWEGLPVNFLHTFLTTVRYEDAYPVGEGHAELMDLMNLEVWGVPTSKPMRDPNNANFVYQRFQRGIMHFDASTGATTQRMLLGDYFKGVMGGQEIPADLEEAAVGSPFYHQYDRSRPLHLARPVELPDTDLTDAFEPEVLETRVAAASWSLFWLPTIVISAMTFGIAPMVRWRRGRKQ